MGLGAGHECAEAEVGDGKHHVEIFMHVAVMQQMMAIQAAEPPWLFHSAGLWQMHAPVDVFVETIVKGEGAEATDHKSPLTREVGQNQKWNNPYQDEHRPIPPSHRDGFLVLFVDEMIGVICLKSPVMNDCVGLEGVAKISNRAVHDIFVKGPFKK